MSVIDKCLIGTLPNATLVGQEIVRKEQNLANLVRSVPPFPAAPIVVRILGRQRFRGCARSAAGRSQIFAP